MFKGLNCVYTQPPFAIGIWVLNDLVLENLQTKVWRPIKKTRGNFWVWIYSVKEGYRGSKQLRTNIMNILGSSRWIIKKMGFGLVERKWRRAFAHILHEISSFIIAPWVMWSLNDWDEFWGCLYTWFKLHCFWRFIKLIGHHRFLHKITINISTYYF